MMMKGFLIDGLLAARNLAGGEGVRYQYFFVCNNLTLNFSLT